ncbi:DUF4249 domain-containing protein [Emticicia sp. 21SJ11W-3]|uniref:DUF4249 domain-containing protein n=1 Tax=Emticicia sp. 21SJ11W-3 TaxID=2916755 RepID=UPI00209C7536|nr:DUF4249 domain-containing protein [Emticicia sp. 21SJ11W-3]UTA66383.1 DUF4249 domain-containing protein [Emticicia sp. 21SJ11W-3]
MRGIRKIFCFIVLMLAGLSCIDQIEYDAAYKVDVLSVEGRVTNGPGEQMVKIHRSKVQNGRAGIIVVEKARVELVVNNTEVIPMTEKEAGAYYLPASFKARTGAAYQLKFELADGGRYESTIEIMPAVPDIAELHIKYNAYEPFDKPEGYKGVHSIYVDVQDPADQENFYSWEYTIYEKKQWCRTCENGIYAVNEVIPGQYPFNRFYQSGSKPYENCFTQPAERKPGAPAFVSKPWIYDYECREGCWEIFNSETMNLFEDRLTNGGRIIERKIARMPYYQCTGALIEIRQFSLTKEAFRYFKHFQEQTENAGGIASTPPTALKGNIRNIANDREVVVGYFAASAAIHLRHFVDRKDTGDLVPPGLFEILNQRKPNAEPEPPEVALMLIWDGPPRVPRATCLETRHSTGKRPLGWIDEPEPTKCTPTKK